MKVDRYYSYCQLRCETRNTKGQAKLGSAHRGVGPVEFPLPDRIELIDGNGNSASCRHRGNPS